VYQRLSRREESLLEANWLLIEACHAEAGSFFDQIAIRLLITYADRWAEASDRLNLLSTYFGSNDFATREAARRTVLNRFDELRKEATGIIVDLATKSWGDRFLIQLIVQPSALDDTRYEQLTIRLSKSIDDQTRYLLAERLGNGLRPQVLVRVGLHMLSDIDWLVRRTAILRAAEHFPNDPRLAQEIARAVATLPARHQRWLQTVAGDLPARDQILAVLGLSEPN
jgi:hypothetical protein